MVENNRTAAAQSIDGMYESKKLRERKSAFQKAKMEDGTVKIQGSTLGGSFTVEAALIMTIMIPVLVSLIYVGFFLHDRAVLQGAACEVAAMAGNLAQEDKRESILYDLKERLGKSRLLGTKNVKSSLSVSENRVSVSYSGSFYVPGLAARLFCANSLSVEAEWSRELFHPADTIRKIRGLKYLADSVKG